MKRKRRQWHVAVYEGKGNRLWSQHLSEEELNYRLPELMATLSSNLDRYMVVRFGR